MIPAPHRKSSPPICWCGNTNLENFSPAYFRCTQCESLVIKDFPQEDITHIKDEAKDLYGANYVDRHLNEDYGQPDFATRSRQDLTDRCLHWLRCVLEFKLPPAELLELGSFHGAFVGLAQLAGFRARGLDLSPDTCQRATRMFGVDIMAGPLGDQQIAPASLDVIALFDVLEHLQDPREMLVQCRKLLRPDGTLVIQTPAYPEGRTFAEMQQRKDPFLALFIPEHLYLLSRTAMARLLQETGFPHFSFEPAVFPQYDMFPIASPRPLVRVEKKRSESELLKTPGGRFAVALLDLNQTTRQTERENLRLNNAITQRDGEIAQLNVFIKERDGRLQQLNVELQQLNESNRSELARTQAALQAAKADVEYLSNQVQIREKHLAELDQQVHQLNLATHERDERLQRLSLELQQLNESSRAELARTQAALQAAKADIEYLSNQVQSRDRRLAELDQSVTRLNLTVSERDERLQAARADAKILSDRAQDAEKRLAELDQQLIQVNVSTRAEIDQLTHRTQLAESQLVTMGAAAQERETLLAKLHADVRTLNMLIHSGDLSRNVETALRRAQREASLASRLLSATQTSQPNTSQWIYLPATQFSVAASPVVANFEIVELTPNLARISGWAFSDEADATLLAAPLLVSTDARGTWIFGGVAVDRPDVVAAYPAPAPLTLARKRSGFVFEFLRQDLPPGVGAGLRVAFAETKNGLSFTPEFNLR